MSSDTSRSVASGPRSQRRGLHDKAYTSREAAQVSGVPFFTVDYWGRTKFLEPTVAKGEGRGKGRQRMYSYGDIVRLRIARELREQKVSLETLRSIVQKLAGATDELAAARYVLIGRDLELASDANELLTLLKRSGRQLFGVVLDLRALLKTVREGVRDLEAERRAAGES